MSHALPTFFLPHGGGPWPFVDLGMPKAEVDGLRALLEGWRGTLPEEPKAALVISAHFEAPKFTVTTAEAPSMLYDYYGFPKGAYDVLWPAPGAPELAERVAKLLSAAAIETAKDGERGFDHGVFVPMKLAFPEADIPTVTLSLKRGLDPSAHYRLGQALAPLRREGVLILGSGMSYHNMRGFGTSQGKSEALPFHAWLRETIVMAPEARKKRLLDWSRAPNARAVHPREEHLLPLMVVAGAADEVTAGEVIYEGDTLGCRHLGARFG